MKCFVLAGGSSDRLWPLSRRDYPKQFMEIREGRSMFQDTILRNIPFCDEFVILTNKRYENVVRAQLQVFQELEYKLIFEEVALKTAPAVIICALQCEPDEEILIAPTDSIIEGDYNTTMTLLKAVVKEDKLAVITCKPANYGDSYNYVYSGKKIVFGAKPSKNSLWDTGIWGAKSSVLLQSLDKTFVEKCKTINIRRNVIERECTEIIKPVNLIKAVATNNCKFIEAAFKWTRITDISSFYNYYNKAIKNNKNAIINNNKGVEIVNMVDDQLVVANGLKNVVIVNTRDTIYVTHSSKEADTKDIANKYYSGNKRYFDFQPKKYEVWGVEELIGSAEDCIVKLITVFPREFYEYKSKKNVVANLFITQGLARVEYGEKESEYTENQNITLTETGKYAITNIGKTNLVFVCTEKAINTNCNKSKKLDFLVKMSPSFKDNMWGGTKIRDIFGKDVGEMDVIAESWELSAHPDGESKIANGEFAGKTLTEYIEIIGKDKLGWKAQAYDRFPIMIKLIDAKQSLSIQVHPADDYAISNEGELGKNEMWHILDADEDAYIYVGFNKDVTKEEIIERIENNTLLQVLNKIPVKKDETYFLKAGTVHAIGAGCLICEVQQSSNVTYRLYDYGRKDKSGKLRELHVNKALDVLDMKKYTPKTYEKYDAIMRYDFVKTLIGQCKYFTVNKYFVDGDCILPPSDSSFRAFVIVGGSGTISNGFSAYEIGVGDTWFSANLENININGKCTVLVVNI